MTVQMTFRGDDPDEEKTVREMVKTMFLTSGAKVTDPKPDRHLKLVKSDEG